MINEVREASATLGCVGPEVDRKQCDAGPCCGWTQWAKWAACNAACGTGSRVRTRVCSSGGSGNEFSRSSSFESNFERSHFTSSVGQSNFAGVRPISPVVGSRCECDGQPVETEVCEAPECVLPPEPLEACTWSTWGPWCGCAGNCQTGIQARTRYCVHEDFSGGRSRARLRDCDCLGEKVQTQDCRPQHCTSKRQQAFEELDDEPVPSSDEVSSKELEDDPQSCWSKCGTDFLKQRTRFCVGLKALINNCECKGAAMEQTSCTPERDAHNRRPASPAVLDVSRDILQSRLASISHGNSETLQRDDVSSMNGTPALSIKKELKKAAKNCEWLMWSEWSECSAECEKEGERFRTRSCSCSMCQGGITKEIESCNGKACTEHHKRYPFD
uniref:Uncharacterized protein n=1 Tax=Acrobeloides nanus TaxID=290746 RepID=A0A914CYI3_9BILA